MTFLWVKLSAKKIATTHGSGQVVAVGRCGHYIGGISTHRMKGMDEVKTLFVDRGR